MVNLAPVLKSVLFVFLPMGVFTEPPLLFFLKKVHGNGGGSVRSNDSYCRGSGAVVRCDALLFFVGFEEIAISVLVPRVSLRNLVSVDRTSTPEDTEGASRSGVQSFVA